MIGSGLQARICDVISGRALPESPSPGDSSKAPAALQRLCDDSVPLHLLRRGSVHPNTATGLILFFRTFTPGVTGVAQPALPQVAEEPSSTSIADMANSKELCIRFALNGRMRSLTADAASTGVLPVWTIAEDDEAEVGHDDEKSSTVRQATKVPHDLGRINLPAAEDIESVTIALWYVMEGLGFPDPRQIPPTAAFHFDFAKDGVAPTQVPPQQDLALNDKQTKPSANFVTAAKSLARRYTVSSSDGGAAGHLPPDSPSDLHGPITKTSAFKVWQSREAAAESAATQEGKKGLASRLRRITKSKESDKEEDMPQVSRKEATLRGRFKKFIGNNNSGGSDGEAFPNTSSSPIPENHESHGFTPARQDSLPLSQHFDTPQLPNAIPLGEAENAVTHGEDTQRTATPRPNAGRIQLSPPPAHATANTPSLGQAIAGADVVSSTATPQREKSIRRKPSPPRLSSPKQDDAESAIARASHDSHVTAPEDVAQLTPTLAQPRPISADPAFPPARQGSLPLQQQQQQQAKQQRRASITLDSRDGAPNALPHSGSSVLDPHPPLNRGTTSPSSTDSASDSARVLASLSTIKTLRTRHADLDAERRDLESAIRLDLLEQLDRERSAWMEKVKAKEDEVRELRAFLAKRDEGEASEGADGQDQVDDERHVREKRSAGAVSEYADAQDGHVKWALPDGGAEMDGAARPNA